MLFDVRSAPIVFLYTLCGTDFLGESKPNLRRVTNELLVLRLTTSGFIFFCVQTQRSHKLELLVFRKFVLNLYVERSRDWANNPTQQRITNSCFWVQTVTFEFVFFVLLESPESINAADTEYTYFRSTSISVLVSLIEKNVTYL